MNRPLSLSLLLFTILSVTVWAGPLEMRNCRFHTMPDISYHAGIHSIAKDSVGRIWFSGYDALYRYDGTSFNRYEDQISSMLPQDYWNFGQIATDGGGNLFIASNHGLLSYDYVSGVFDLLIPGNIGSLVASGDGSVWFVRSGSVCRNSPIGVEDCGFSSNSEHDVNLMTSTSGNVFAALGDSLFTFDRKSLRSSLFACLGVPSAQIKDVEEFAGATYVLTLIDGVFELDRSGRRMRHFSLPQEYGRAASAKELYVDPSGVIWTATQSGLLLIDTRSGETSLIRSDARNPFSLPNNSVWTIYPDPDGGVWIGTFGGKLAYTTTEDGDVDRLFKASVAGLSNPIVSCFAEDASGNLWIGTEGGGISVWNRRNDSFSYYTQQDGSGLHSNMVKHLYLDEKGVMWVSSFNGGVQKMLPSSDKFIDVCPGRGSSQRLISVYDFVVDGNVLWMTDPDTELMKMDMLTGEMSAIELFDTDGSVVQRMRPETAFLDSYGHLWLVTHKGAYEVDQNNCRVMRHCEIEGAAYAANNLCSYYCDSDGNFWFGTRGAGVNVLSASGSYDNFKDVNGESLAGKTVFGILQDKASGDMWFSTNDGLYVYSTASSEISRSQIDNPSLCGAYYARSCALSSRGEMLFGSTDGFLLFTPSKVHFNTLRPKAYLTDVIINDSRLPDSSVMGTAPMVFSHNQNNIEVGFSCNSYLKSENNRYSYRMKGLSDSWVMLPPLQKTVQFFNLPPGKYVLDVKASNNDGVWGDEVAALKFRVRPHPLRSWWAYFLYALTLAVVAWLVFRFFKIRRNLARELELEQIKERNARELNQARTKFFTNISHDLKTPLTLILGPVRQMKEHLEQGSEAMSYISLIESNVGRIQRMIGMLLQFRELESQKLTMDPRPGEFVGFLKSIFNLFEFYSNRKNIEMGFDSEQESMDLVYDHDAVEKIFTNLFSNAIKYTPEGNFIGVRISSLREDGTVRIDVTNTGVDIPEEKRAVLFEAFSGRSANADRTFESSTGLGLAIVKELVMMMGGSIKVDSSDMKVTFSVTLPLRQSDAGANPGDVSYEYTESELDNLIADLDDQEQEHESGNARKAKTVVVMEDDTALRRYIKQRLSEYYNVYTAHDGKEGLELLAKYNPELVLTDLSMPQLDGFEVCRRIRADFKTSHIPVIVLSGQGDVDDTRVQAIESGANMFIDKPVDVDFLLKQIENLLKTREKLREFYSKKFVAEPSKLTITSMDENLLNKAMSCIEKNMDNNDYDVNEFVSDMAVGRTILYQKIKDITGMSIREFIMDVRLKRAAQLLKDSDRNVSEVSIMTGFINPKYFSVCFKRRYEMTPSEYKKKYCDGNQVDSVQNETISV